MEAYTYVLDNDLTIINCSDNWDAFAYDNRGSHSLRADVVGTSLMQWISGEETRKLYLEAFAGIPMDGDVCIMPFRCDSPDAKRQFECRITRFRFGYIVCNTLLETRPLGISLEWVHVHCRDAVPRCSICGRFEWHGSWRAPEDLLDGEVTGPIRVRHTVCACCSLLIKPQRQLM